MNNKNRPHIPVKTGMQGFSLIEFLVASALSMIVLLAVSSGYFTARSLNTAATSRLNVQQDLRNASNQIVRDARMAGNFGCFNMSGYDAQAVIKDFGSKEFFTLKNGQMLSAVRETNDLGATGFKPISKALIFQYGIDAENPKNLKAETAVASSCTNITKPGNQITDVKAALAALNLKTDSSQAGNISIMKHEVNAYAVGTAGGQDGLYRFQLAENGEWSNPQLLIKGIKSMKIRYFYAEKCPQTDVESRAASAPPTGNTQNQGQTQGQDETFTYSDELPPKDPDLAKETPASIELLLNSNDKRELGSINASGGNDKNEVQIYRINATVRGGNKCADRLL
ncbi:MULTISPECIES: PilW family protein [Neisseriaceae]|jgi:prepilin-type N-cleavage/methylation domain protein|uniref:PilW family protein n=1 Tax=Neisseriaceae TaxID=481 RepID=UPI000667E469|nr:MULTISPECIES: prepilin-type N-terminal cleavage/methylation domain-containing protein [Neisseriaceae]MBS6045976.1 prepilin-type N-terminal cleavage/methylation domain-containing protein [Neisseria sp.]MDU4438785.1 prepilin-type N-terminal cleavage/methylation domain-containing protein [Neisseria sp.]OFN00259.1 pilus assembly protein PilW [Neisseria sp. HMSC055F11]